jgi:hypothetical protein
MKALLLTILAASLAIGSTAVAKGPLNQPGDAGSSQLRQALGAIAATANAQGPKPEEHFKPKSSNGQGALHANPEAILRVCSKDTPAADRAAICQVGISPE